MLKEQLPPETEELKPHSRDSKRGDRILIWCFLASILINLGFGLWLNYADIYGEKRQADTNKVMKVAVYKPPIKQKPKPKLIPPKPKIIPKIVHVQPRPTPPRPTPPRPAPPQHFTVGTHSKSPTAVVVEPPAPPVREAPVQPVQPQNTTVTPTPPAPAPPPPAPSAPKPAPPAPVYHAPPAPKPAPPPPPKHDRNYLPINARPAEISGNPTVDASGIDPPPTDECVVSATITVDGQIRHVRVKKQSGSIEFDNRCVDAVQRDARGVPAVQDNEKYEASAEYSFPPPSG